MGTYTLNEFILPNGLDEIGLRLGLQRFKTESLSDYRKRLLAEIRDPAGATEDSFIRSINRQVGLSDIPVFQIDLILDSDNEPLAASPMIEITSTRLNAYIDYENRTLDFSIDLADRTNGYFLKHVYQAFFASLYYNITILDTDYTYKYSNQLRYGISWDYVLADVLTESRSNKLDKSYIINFAAQAIDVFQNEKLTYGALAEAGDYFIDYTQGVVFTYLPAKGLVSYSHRVFPYLLYWQPVRTFPLNDTDLKYKYRNTIVADDTGLIDYVLLNSDGAAIIDQVLVASPLEWGF